MGKDPLDQAMALLQKEQRAFQGHWIWEKLRCRPEEFFQAFRRHVDSLKIPKDQWEQAYEKARADILRKAGERKATLNPFPLQILSGLKV